MAEPMKIRAQLKGDVAAIRILIHHPMETGLRKDAAGTLVPAHHIHTLTVDVGDRRIVDIHTGTAVSRNPVFAFKAKGAKADEKVVVSWVDTKGERRTDEAVLA